jgi:hypothetical protein
LCWWNPQHVLLTFSTAVRSLLASIRIHCLWPGWLG